MITIALFLLVNVADAQNAEGSVGSISGAFENYRNRILQEKIYVHTDKAFYVAGEIIWFKIYAVDAHLNRPLALSKVCYIELISKDNRQVLHAKISMQEDGTGSGSFQLPYSVNTGTCLIRAYTNWMKNESADYFFEKEITIINGLKKPEWPVLDKPEYDVQFFPEGGALINGIASKVAFKITDAQGKGIDSKGVLLNRKNDTIARFSSLLLGMGHFEFTPDAGENYHAVLFVNGNNISAISQAAITLLADPVLCSRMGSAGRAWIEKDWDWKLWGARFNQLLKGN